MSKEVIRFEDKCIRFSDMLDEILVACPQCARYAKVILTPADTVEKSHPIFMKRRLFCSHCSLVKEWDKGMFHFEPSKSPICDPYFDAPLWFQMSCCGHILWALNRRHLCYLEEYVRATLRGEAFISEYHSTWSGMASILPKWMKLAKHREPVLACLEKLKRKL